MMTQSKSPFFMTQQHREEDHKPFFFLEKIETTFIKRGEGQHNTDTDEEKGRVKIDFTSRMTQISHFKIGSDFSRQKWKVDENFFSVFDAYHMRVTDCQNVSLPIKHIHKSAF